MRPIIYLSLFLLLTGCHKVFGPDEWMPNGWGRVDGVCYWGVPKIPRCPLNATYVVVDGLRYLDVAPPPAATFRLRISTDVCDEYTQLAHYCELPEHEPRFEINDTALVSAPDSSLHGASVTVVDEFGQYDSERLGHEYCYVVKKNMSSEVEAQYEAKRSEAERLLSISVDRFVEWARKQPDTFYEYRVKHCIRPSELIPPSDKTEG